MDKEMVVDSQHFDANIGSVYIEIPLMLRSESGEAKHTDLNNQGLFLAYEISRFLKTLSSSSRARPSALRPPIIEGRTTFSSAVSSGSRK